MKISEKVDMRDMKNLAVDSGLSSVRRVVLVGITVVVAGAILAIAGGIWNHHAQANATPVLLHNVKIDKAIRNEGTGKSHNLVTKTVVKGFTKSGKYVVTTLIDNKTPSVTRSGKNSLSTTLYKDDSNRYYAAK